jgi:stage V sporulation protein G
MQIEVIDIRKSVSDGNLKAYADVKIGGNLVIKGFAVMNGRKGVFVSMPRKAAKDGRWFDILKPLDESLRKEIEDKVLEAFDRETDGVRS